MAKANTKRNGSRKGSRPNRGNKQATNGHTVWTMKQGKVHSFMRLLNAGELPIGGSDGGFSTIFSLSQLPNSSDFTKLFDQYCIDRVEVTFEMDISDGALNSTTRWPRVAIAPDFNNQGAPLSENEVLSYEQSRQYQFSTSERRFTTVLRPMVAATIFRTGVTSAYEMKKAGWLDVATNDVPHYGLRYFITNHNTTSFGSSRICVYQRYHFRCRNAS